MNNSIIKPNRSQKLFLGNGFMPNRWQAITWTFVDPDFLLTQYSISKAQWINLIKYRRIYIDIMILNDPIV